MTNIFRLMRRLLQAIVVVYVAFPVLFYSFLPVRQFFVFGTYIVWPFHDYEKPTSYDLPYAKNFYINSVGDIRLGAWYIPAKSIWNKLSSRPTTGNQPQQWMLEDDRPVIIYYHGHAQCRACDYRIGLYKTLSQSGKLDAHVFAFDYRGFGDSTNVLPDRAGVLLDSAVVFDYVRKLVKGDDARILIWGHSLGTAIAVQLAEAFTELPRNPMGLVLEAPFNSLSEAAFVWPLSLPYRFLPYAQRVTDELKKHDETFYETEQLTSAIKLPVLLIHSADDFLVPFKLGHKLFDNLRVLNKKPVHFYQANDTYSLGHRYIYKDPKVQDVVADFIRLYGKATRTANIKTTDRHNSGQTQLEQQQQQQQQLQEQQQQQLQEQDQKQQQQQEQQQLQEQEQQQLQEQDQKQQQQQQQQEQQQLQEQEQQQLQEQEQKQQQQQQQEQQLQEQQLQEQQLQGEQSTSLIDAEVQGGVSSQQEASSSETKQIFISTNNESHPNTLLHLIPEDEL